MKSALIIVDVQNDFCIGGSLEIRNADEIFAMINKINKEFPEKFKLKILTQDWHPEEHISFKGNSLESKLVNPSEITLKWKVKIIIIIKIHFILYNFKNFYKIKRELFLFIVFNLLMEPKFIKELSFILILFM